mgnify:CR=1 FL=1
MDPPADERIDASQPISQSGSLDSSKREAGTYVIGIEIRTCIRGIGFRFAGHGVVVVAANAAELGARHAARPQSKRLVAVRDRRYRHARDEHRRRALRLHTVLHDGNEC